MNVTATANLDTLREAYARAARNVEEKRQAVDEATISCNQKAAEADKQANKINRWVKVRNLMPMVGMGSFMVGMGTVNAGVILHNPWLAGISLLGFATCAACVVGIETWKVKGPRMRAEHDALVNRFYAQQGQVTSLAAAHQGAVAQMHEVEAALRKEEAQIDELQRLLKPPTPGGVSEQSNAVVVGGIRVPKRPMEDKRSLF